MQKHAYLILAHNQFELLKILIELLDDERNDLYVHIDSKVDNFDFEKFSKIPKKSNIYYTDRVCVTWGSFSQIQCEMTLLKAAVKNCTEENCYAYYHFISGVDLPIKTNDEIHDFFDENAGKEFLYFSSNRPLLEFENRIKYYHFFRSKRNTLYKIIAQVLLIIQKVLHVNRLKNKNIVVQKGTNWVSITDDFAKYIVSNESFVDETFSKSYCADEIFIQTMFVNSPFCDNLYMKNCNNNQLAAARLIDWNRGNPYVFTLSDFDEIKNPPAMFARKFDLNKDSEIVYKIKDFLS